MTTLHEIAAHWLVRSLGWTLLHFCWQGALIALILWCSLQLLARRPAQERYIAACIALGLLVALPLITFTRIGVNEYRLAMELKNSALPDDPSFVLRAGLGDAASWLARVASVLDPTLPWVLMAWFFGLVVSLVRLSVGLRLALRMKFAAVSPAATALQEMFVSLRQRLGILRPISLMNSAFVQVPTVVGWLRPVVLIPVSCFTGLSDMQIEAILCHELAHIRRHDYLVSVVQSVVEAVLFYHPAVWWVSQQLRRERECCCDDLAVTVGGNALAYARALSTLETRRGTYPEVVLGSNGGVLTMRIKRLLQCEEVSAVPQFAAIVVLVVLTIAAGAIAGTARAEARSTIAVEPVATPAVSTGGSALAQAQVGHDSLVKAHDLLEVHIAETPAISGKYVVSGNGQVELPLVGRIQASGVSESALAARIADAYSRDGFIYKPHVMASLAPHSLKPAPTTEAVPPSAATPAVESQQAQAAPTGPARIAGGIMAGQIITKTQPVYPDIARAAHVSGAVVLHALIGKNGEISALQVIDGPEMLRASAIDAVRQWTYKPYLLNGEPTEVDTTITVNYSFGGNPEPNPPNPNEGSDAVGMVPRRVGGSVSAPVLVTAPLPEYTPEARAAKISGIVVVHFWVDEQGRPSHVQVVRGLDAKAVDVVKNYQFKPALEGGKPVVVALNTEINFQMF